MTVTFHSDYSVNGKGFKAIWKALENSGGGKNWELFFISLLSSEEIQSPGYPDGYPDNLNEVKSV